MVKVKELFTNKKIVVAVAVAAVAVGCFVFFGKGGKPQATNGIITNGVRTTTLRHTTLADTVTVTGTVESVQTINVTGTAEGTTVKEITVQVGDSVSKDEVIMKLDTGTILERIEKEKEKLAESYDTAFKRREDAEEARDEAKDRVESAETSRDTAYNEMGAKKAVMNTAKADFDVAITATAPKQSAYNTALEEEKQAIDNYSKAVDALAKAQENGEDTTTRQADLETATQELETAKENVKDTAEALETEKTLVNYNDLEKAYTSAKSAYDTAVANYNSKAAAVDSREKSYEQKKETYEDYIEDLRDYTTSDTLEDLYEQYNDCIIKASESGTVTAINVEVGGSANGTLAVIQDTAHLKISTSFAESDVQNIAIGMKCTITSDANDNVITGYVSQISPTAGGISGMGMSSSSGDVSFPAEITIEGTDHGLLIGMNAQADVILSQKTNIFTVPYDAVGTNENGEKVVYVQDTEDKEKFTPVVVTTGMETDYYIEISSESLEEGMVIRSSANESESGNEMFVTETEEGEMPQMGGFGNMGGFGGGMPSGGNRPQGMPQGGGMPGGRG